MTSPGGNPPETNKEADLRRAQKAAAAAAEERRLTPRAGTATPSAAGGMKPIVWIAIAVVVIAAIAYFMF
jgi:hypothetical protein